MSLLGDDPRSDGTLQGGVQKWNFVVDDIRGTLH